MKREFSKKNERRNIYNWCGMSNKTNAIVIICLIILIQPVSAVQNMEYVVQNGKNCELIARYYQEKYHTELYIIVPLKDNGALETGANKGHIINSKIVNGKRYFFEFNGVSGDNIFATEKEVKAWYKYRTGKDSSIYDTQNTPFPMIWNY